MHSRGHHSLICLGIHSTMPLMAEIRLAVPQLAVSQLAWSLVWRLLVVSLWAEIQLAVIQLAESLLASPLARQPHHHLPHQVPPHHSLGRQLVVTSTLIQLHSPSLMLKTSKLVVPLEPHLHLRHPLLTLPQRHLLHFVTLAHLPHLLGR